MPNLYRVVHLGKNHPVQDWPAARLGYWYPETEQLNLTAGVSKIGMPYTPAMMKWLVSMQVSTSAAKNLLRVGAVLFNKNRNLYYWNWPPPIPNYIPLYGPWPAKPVAEGIVCGGNIVNVIGTSGAYYKVECIKPFTTGAPLYTKFTHQHLFARLYEVQIGSGAVRAGGLYWPMFSPTGYAFMRKELLVKI